ncbi:MAG: hypothetical protein R6V57_04860 [Vicinamibacterales bacterium]
MKPADTTAGLVRHAGWRCAIAALLVLAPAGCVIIPYEPEAETRHELADVPDPELVRLSVGPRRMLAEMGEAICKAEPRIEAVNGQAFIDAAAPDGELTLARLLDAGTGPRIESLGLDYLVVLAEPVDQELHSRGGMAFYLGFFGLVESKTSSSLGAAIVDLKELKLVEQVTSTATGTDRGVGLFYGLFIVSDTRGGAEKALVRGIIDDIAAARPAGPVRIVLLASEPIRTAEDFAAEERRARHTLWIAPQAIDAYPRFSEPDPPTAEEGLIYLYRPEDAMGSLWPLTMRSRSQAGEFEITRLWSGGYRPFRAPVGEVQVWVETDPSRVVTLEVEPGGVYYVRASFRMGWAQIPSRVEAVDPSTGRREVRRCRQLPSTREYIAQVREAAEQGYTFRQLELAGFYSTGVAYGPDEALPRDNGEAYMWYSIVLATEDTRPEWRTLAGTGRDEMAARMDPGQIAAAARRALEWQAREREPS